MIDPDVSPNLDHEKDMETNGAPVVMVVLFALVALGLHIPTGG